MSDTMLAVRKPAASPGWRLEEVPIPAPGPDEVLIEVEAASICGTDLHIVGWDAWASRRVTPPMTLGHELAGTVVGVGVAVSRVGVGASVACESHVTCRRCAHCRSGQAHVCPSTRIIGVDRDGGFAQYVAVPEQGVWRNDAGVLPPHVACLLEPFGNAVYATARARLERATVAVLGCGPIGLFTIAIARASRCLNLLAVDRSPFRPALAERLGAHGVVTAGGPEDAAATLRAGNAGDGMDVVFEMAGAARSVKDAFAAVRDGGRVVLFGLPARPVELDIAEHLSFRNVEVTAASGREIFATWYQAARLLRTGVVDLEPLVTHRATLDGFEEAIELLQLGAAGKIVLDPQAPLGTGVVATDAMRASAWTPAPALV